MWCIISRKARQNWTRAISHLTVYLLTHIPLFVQVQVSSQCLRSSRERPSPSPLTGSDTEQGLLSGGTLALALPP